MLQQYFVVFRASAALDIQDVDGRVISAFRVEGWTKDYAFFGNPEDMSSPTVLIPREIVAEVRLDFYQGTGIGHLQQELRREQAAAMTSTEVDQLDVQEA